MPAGKLHHTSPRLHLRPYTLKDHQTWKRAHEGRPEKVGKYELPHLTEPNLTRGAFTKRVKRQKQLSKEGHHHIFGIFDKKTGQLYGEVDFFLINKQLRWANLWYLVFGQHWGKGIATEASAAALAIGFGALDYHRIEAGCEIKNKASMKVAQKSGLRREGVRRKFFPQNGGEDYVMYGQNQIDYGL